MFRLVRVFGPLLWAGSIAVAASATDAAASAPPVTIDACRIVSSHSFVAGYKPIALSFTVHGSVPARRVRFAVDYAGRAERVSDGGTFSPNVEIDHAFSGFYDARYLSASPECRVEFVEFSDGTTWTNGPVSTSSPPA